MMRCWIFIILVTLVILSCQHQEKMILSPDEAIADFEIEKGFEITCAASEPMVQDPVAIAFDDDGNMWVVEMNTFMQDANGIGEMTPCSRIKILSDKDDDGLYETVNIFADSMILPRAICPVYDGVLIAEPPYLWFYDKSGKNRIAVDSTYAEGGNVEHQPNGLIMGIDNWIYSAKSDKRYRLYHGKWEKENTVFRGQWGIDQDNEGRLYYNHNSAVLLGDQWPPSTIPYLAAMLGEKMAKRYGQSLVGNKVYPRNPSNGINRGYETGVLDSTGRLDNVTASCGISLYGGGQFDNAYTNNGFSCEPAAQLIKRIVLENNAGIISGKLPYTNQEFLRSGDEKFRPVFTTTGPDGALYVVDMYRGIIQHITYLTGYLRKHIESHKLDQFHGMGRIYRIVQSGNNIKKEIIGNKSGESLVALLAHDNRWVRIRAQWKILHANDEVLYGSLLRKQFFNAKNDITRLHILQILNEYRSIDKDILNAAADGKISSLRHTAMAILRNRDFHTFIEKRRPNHEMDEMNFVAALFNHNATDDALTTSIVRQYSNDSLFSAIIAGGLWQHNKSILIDEIKKSLPKKTLLYQWLKSSPTTSNIDNKALAHLTKAQIEMYNEGKHWYSTYCAGCHGKNGEGIDKIAPPLSQSEWITASNYKIPTSIILNGISGPISVAGKDYNFTASMTGLRDNQTINDGSIAKILTFVRNSWGNKSSPVSTEEVSKVRVAPPMTIHPSMKLDNQKSKKINKPQILQKLNNSLSISKPKALTLFNGKNLDGWKVVGGKAKYEIKNKILFGHTSVNTPNTFLITAKPYADFILELDIWIDTMLNSGIQIRSNMYRNYNNGVLHGYQVEVDPSPRAWSGGLYDESRRGWLYDLKNSPEAQKAFRNNNWNHYRIEAMGNTIKTFINDNPVTDYTDSLTRSGYIGLQVHSIGQDSNKIGREVRWKNVVLTDLGGTIWTASEEDKNNLLYWVYDGNDNTYWTGESLHLQFADDRRRTFKIVSKSDITIAYSNDNLIWHQIAFNETKVSIPKSKYLMIKGKYAHNIEIQEIAFQKK